MIVSHPEVPSPSLIHYIACDFIRFSNFSFHNHRQTQERQKKSFSFTLQVQIGTKRLQIEYTKESMVDDNNEKSFYSLQQKKEVELKLGMELKVENITRLDAMQVCLLKITRISRWYTRKEKKVLKFSWAEKKVITFIIKFTMLLVVWLSKPKSRKNWGVIDLQSKFE